MSQMYPDQEINTLRTFRQRAAREFGPFLASTITSATSTVVTDTKWPVFSMVDQDQLWKEKYLFRPDAAAVDQVRIVYQYVPNLGQLYVDTPYVTAPTAGEYYEMHAIVDPREMTTLINEALRHCFTTVEFTVAPVPRKIRHSLIDAAPWLTSVDWVRAVGVLNNTEDRDEVDPYMRHVRGQVRLYPTIQNRNDPVSTIVPSQTNGNITVDGTLTPILDPSYSEIMAPTVNPVQMVAYLEHPGQTFDAINETLYVYAIQPLYFQCSPAAASTPGARQYGLVRDNDVCPANAEWVASRTLVEGWRKFDNLMEPAANQRLIMVELQAAMWFTEMSSKCFRLPPLDFRPLMWGGPRNRSFGPMRGGY